MFTIKPDFRPYVQTPSDRRVFREEDTFDPSDPKFEKRRKMKPMVKMDDPKFVEALRNGKIGGTNKDDDDEDDLPR